MTLSPCRRRKASGLWAAAAVVGALLSRAGAEGPPDAKAWTRGDFTIRYELVKESNVLRARNVRVQVKNRTHYAESPSPLLVHHEDVHRRINRLGAQGVQARLTDFQVAAVSPRQAERAFRAEFRRQLREVEELHRAWDATHKIPSPYLAKGTDSPYP